ncbi:hypothetical protein Tco_0377209 [Tanacetum coccineum]
MGSITSLKCVLTQENLDAICAKYFVPEEVHPQLPSSDATMHERPTGMDLNAFIRTADPCKYRVMLPSVPVTEPVEAEVPKPKRSKKKRVVYDSEGLPIAAHPPKRLRADYGTTGGSVTGGKSLSVLTGCFSRFSLTVEKVSSSSYLNPYTSSVNKLPPLEEAKIVLTP